MSLLGGFRNVADPFHVLPLGGGGRGPDDVRRTWELMRQAGETGFQGQESYLRKSLNARNAGYGSALADVDRAEVAGGDQIALAGQAGLQAARGIQARSGLADPAVALASARDTRRAIADMQMNLARQRSGLRIAQGSANAAGLGALANFEAYKAERRQNNLGEWFRYKGHRKDVSDQNRSASLGGIGQLAGLALGGAFGGGGSGYVGSANGEIF